MRNPHAKFTPTKDFRLAQGEPRPVGEIAAFCAHVHGEGGVRAERINEAKNFPASPNWRESMSAEVLAKIDACGYLYTPYESREEYVEILTAITQFPEYRGLLQRKNKDCAALTVPRRSMGQKTAEYFLNGSRFVSMNLKSYAPRNTHTYRSIGNLLKLARWGGLTVLNLVLLLGA